MTQSLKGGIFIIRLDHFVVHIDNDMDRLKRLKQEIKPLGFPFEPEWGKGTKGFKAANIWIGSQYFELVWLKTKDGGEWKPDWVNKYNRGHRGIVGIFFMTDQLDQIRGELYNRGIPVSEPERGNSRWFFGLLKKTLPWRRIFTDPIPGTDLQICFIELNNSQIMKKMKNYMVPNATVNGILGIKRAAVYSNFSQEACAYINKLFPAAKNIHSSLICDMGDTELSFVQCREPQLRLELWAVVDNSRYTANSFEIENVQLNI